MEKYKFLPLFYTRIYENIGSEKRMNMYMIVHT